MVTSCIPKISVVMPAYNADKYIKEAITSILNQSYKDYELIIINDGSTDNTNSIIKRFKDPRLKYYLNNSNHGIVYSLNKGFELALGKYITRMDADDISLTNRLEIQYEFMESNPTIGISGGQMEIFGHSYGYSDYPLTHDQCLIRLLDQACFSNNNFIIRRDLIIKHELSFSYSYIHAEDYKFYVDLIIKIKGANLPNVLTRYRQHENSITDKYFKIAFANRKKIRIEYLQKLLNTDFNIALDFYGPIGRRKYIALKRIRTHLIQKFKDEEKYINQLLLEKIWYKDALYESKKNFSSIFKYPYIFLYQINLKMVKNWINLLKHRYKN